MRNISVVKKVGLLATVLVVAFTVFKERPADASPKQASVLNKSPEAKSRPMKLQTRAESLRNERLLHELMNKNKIGEANIVSLANHGYRYMALNWIESLERTGYHRFVVLCFDRSLLEFMHERGFTDRAVLVPTNWLDFDITENATRWAKQEYSHMVQSKMSVLNHLLSRNYSILFSDPDTVWLSRHVKQHIDFTFTHSFAEILFSQDQIVRQLHFNTGFFYAKPTEFVIGLFAEVIERQKADPDGSIDQLVMHGLMLKRGFSDPRVDSLDPFLFASGQVYFNYGLNGAMGIGPLVVHVNYRKGLKEKVDTLVKANLWYVNASIEA
jgi:hypothetical protein